MGRKLRNHEKQFRLLTKIIRTRVLKARSGFRTSNGRAYILNKHYGRQLSSNDAYEGSYICFCDIPLRDLSIHMAKFSKFGLAFSKNYFAEKGAVPVMYVPERGRPSLLPFKTYRRHRVSSQSVSFDEFWKCFNRLDSSTTQAFLRRIQPETAKDLEKVIGFLDFNILSHLKFFNHKLDDVARGNSTWRENGGLAAMLGLASPPLSESSSRSASAKGYERPSRSTTARSSSQID